MAKGSWERERQPGGKSEWHARDRGEEGRVGGIGGVVGVVGAIGAIGAVDVVTILAHFDYYLVLSMPVASFRLGRDGQRCIS